ncbi:MAG: hypothetical protein A2020_11305 [Lentisphaerae bacterium GWF2_45_14]|nr:MAG: hypothetical protein A2020_11305 [Lentisphaerae bacterium GWF2_45_14]
MKKSIPALSLLIFLISIPYACVSNHSGEQIKIPLDSIEILIPEHASDTEEYAARELNIYIGKMIGKKTPVRKESEKSDAACKFFVGKTSAAEKYIAEFKEERENVSGNPEKQEELNDAYIMDIKPGTVILVGGGERGTLYSVYEFLENCGYRCFFPGPDGEIIPDIKTVEMPEGKHIFRPAFIQREIQVSPGNPYGLKNAMDWSVKNRLNRNAHVNKTHFQKMLPQTDWKLWNIIKMQEWQANVHNFDVIVPTEKYFETHPEYFALYKGKRLPQDTKNNITWKGGNLCLTNPEVIKLCADFAIDWFDKHPDGLIVPMWPMDGNTKWCECENCVKYGGINDTKGDAGSMTRRLLVFVNEVARIVARKYPDKFILMPSYHEYKSPVSDITPRKNVIVQLCLHVDYVRSMDKTKCPLTIERLKDLKTWSKTTPNIGVWEYFLLGNEGGWVNGKWKTYEGDANAYLPVLYRTIDIFKFLHDNGVKWYFTQANNKYWAHNTLQYYVAARMLWNPDQDAKLLLDDYFEKMYGNAAPYMNKYFTTIEDSVKKSDWIPNPGSYKELVVVNSQVYTPEVMASCEKALGDAKKCTLASAQRKRLKLVEESFEYIKNQLDKKRANK